MTRQRALRCTPLLVAAVVSISTAAARAQTGPTAGAALVSELDVNGLKVLVKRRPGSQTISAALFIRGGSANLTAANAGIESLMLDVATAASAKYPRERLRREEARTGTAISAGSNPDYSVLSLTATRANFDSAWNLFADVALHPAFTAEDFELAKTRMSSGLRGEMDDPDTYLQRLQNTGLYVGHPYLNSPEGTVASVASIALPDIRFYHGLIMQTSRLLLVIVGDLDPEQLRPRIAASFGQLPRGGHMPAAPPRLSFVTPTVVVTQRALPTNYVQGMFAAPSITDPDIYAMRVATSLLNDRVFEEVRVKRNLSYSPDAFLKSQGSNVGGIYVTAVDANQAVGLMLNEIKRLQSVPLEQTDIDDAAAQYLTNYYLGQETNAAQAGDLAEYEIVGGGWRNSFETISRLLAVRPADVQRVAQTYMKNLQFVVLGDSAKIDRAVFTGQK
jgi:predicted Zn-dependent peptidase